MGCEIEIKLKENLIGNYTKQLHTRARTQTYTPTKRECNSGYGRGSRLACGIAPVGFL